MNSLDPQHPPSSAGGSRGWLITSMALLGTILVPLCVRWQWRLTMHSTRCAAPAAKVA